jgi:VIT1/CCC1 family predicted Fe2+/Mn2+ transporter
MSQHAEVHYVNRAGWLRAAVLGANDGIISTASLIVGIAAAAGGRSEILTAALAGWAAGAMAMAAGEYVSVSSQSDLEGADIERERRALIATPHEEMLELADIYEKRGLSPEFAKQVARQLMEKDALGAHARDELGLGDEVAANPIQAAFASAIAFSVGAAMPTVAAFMAPQQSIPVVVAVAALVFLVLLGGLGGWMGGAPVLKPALRVGFWGAMAMGVTAGIGALIGRAV